MRPIVQLLGPAQDTVTSNMVVSVLDTAVI